MDARDNARGAGLMMISMAAFTLNDACMKLLSGSIPLAQAVLMRGMLVTLLLFAVAWHRGGLSLRFAPADTGLIAIRTVAELGATYFFLTALFNMPLPNVTAILQVLPLSVALGAALVFREPLGWRRLVAIAAGFAGVMLIVQPGGPGFTIYSIYALAAVACVTCRDLASRRLSPEVPSLSVALITALAITLAAAFAMPFDGAGAVTPSWWELRMIALAAFFVFGGYLGSVMTMRVGEIGFIAPFRYTGLIWALVVGWYLFGDFPNRLALLGAVLVVAMGLFSLYRERVIARRRVALRPR